MSTVLRVSKAASEDARAASRLAARGGARVRGRQAVLALTSGGEEGWGGASFLWPLPGPDGSFRAMRVDTVSGLTRVLLGELSAWRCSGRARRRGRHEWNLGPARDTLGYSNRRKRH